MGELCRATLQPCFRFANSLHCCNGTNSLACRAVPWHAVHWGQHVSIQPSALHCRRSGTCHCAGISERGTGNESVTSAYIHIPFCRRRCHYCDFPIVAVGQNTDDTHHVDKVMADYVDLVCREIAITAGVREKQQLVTVFFGGGTPSLLPPPMLSLILECLRHNFGLSPGAEVSMEMDPGTFDANSLKQLLELGVTRVSLGVQAFQEALLRQCGRSHGLEDVYKAIDVVHSSGLVNWSLDLISSLPNQTVELWEHSLREAVQARPAHISVYDLQIEPGTQFFRWYKPGNAPLPSDDRSADLFRLASKTLTDAGFEHYEISNYARPGFYCRHNKVYWLNRPYYAFGLGSTSYVDGIRFSRPKRLNRYSAFVSELEASQATLSSPENCLQDTLLDTIMLSLRLSQGLNVQKLLSDHGLLQTMTVLRALLPFVKSGHALVLDELGQPVAAEGLADFCDRHSGAAAQGHAVNSNSHDRSPGSVFLDTVARARLSDPEGFLFSNEVISSVFAALSRN